MSENRQNDSADTTYRHNGLSIEELDELISNAIFGDDVDAGLLDELLDIYDKHEDAPKVDVEAALVRFKRDYSGQGKICFAEDAENPTQTISTKKSVHPQRGKCTLRYGYAAAALIVISAIFLFATPAGASVRLAVGNWTSETFGFGPQRFAARINPELERLHEALADSGVTDKIASTWIPDGFMLSDFTVVPTPGQTLFYALFSADTRSITIQIVMLSDISIRSYEKDESEVVLYPHNGIDHYIMTNNGKTNAVWSTGNFECSIVGDVTVDEVKQMIDSIYER